VDHGRGGTPFRDVQREAPEKKEGKKKRDYMESVPNPVDDAVLGMDYSIVQSFLPVIILCNHCINLLFICRLFTANGYISFAFFLDSWFNVSYAKLNVYT
jgi:hypothetical protein